MMRKLMWFAIGFLAACTFFSYVWFSGLLWLLLGLMALALLLGWLSRKDGRLAIVSLVVAGCAMGCGWFWAYDGIYLSDARAMDGKVTTAAVTISDYSYESDYGTAADGRVKINGKTYKVRIYFQQNQKLAPSDVISGTFQFRFTAMGGSRDPNSLRTEGITLILYQRGSISVSTPEKIQLRDYPAVWRNGIVQRIKESLPADSSGFAAALLVGDREGIDYQTNTAFKVSGISHIIAVSGLHISILFGLIYTLSFRRRWLAAVIGVPVLLLFAAVVGFTPSVTRACLMQILMLLAMLTEREYDPPTALAFSVLAMLVVNPMTAASVSFQLSASCMTGILLFNAPVSQWLQQRRICQRIGNKGKFAKCKNWLLSSVSVSVSASVLTTPLVAIYFGTVSLVGILTNLLTLWVISFIFYGLLLVCAVSLISQPVAMVFGMLISLPIRYVIGVAKVIADFPLAAVYTKSTWIVLWLVVCYLLLGAFFFMKKKRPLLLIGSAAVSLCIALLLSWGLPRTDNYRMTVLDVGQGQCILLQSDGRTYMVDCGGSTDQYAADQAAEYLLSQGVFRLDGIILTHYDLDHAGGVAYLLSRVPADALYIPDISDEGSIKVQLLNSQYHVNLISKDTELNFGSTRITLFASETVNSGNESGLCILFNRENCDILITGDRGEVGEEQLLNRVSLPYVDVLVAGHHGSANSTGVALLNKTVPEIVVISAGENNPYGHPSPALLERLQAWGCKIWRTDLVGTITYRG